MNPRTRIMHMLTESRTWTTILYLLLMLPLGIAYFTTAVTGLALGAAFVPTPLAALGARFGWFGSDWQFHSELGHTDLLVQHPVFGSVLLFILGVLVLTLLMHAARGIVRGHARLAKALLVERGA